MNFVPDLSNKEKNDAPNQYTASKGSATGQELPSHAQMLHWQRTIGNRATMQLIQKMKAPGNAVSGPSGQAPIQMMPKKDFETKFVKLMGIKNKFQGLAEIKQFKEWLIGTLSGKTDKTVDEFIGEDDFSDATLGGYVEQYKMFQGMFGPLEPKNKIEDVPVPQGMFYVASQTELESGLYTDGVSPCVAVGFQIHLSDDGASDILALGHFDSETDPGMLQVMFESCQAKAGAEMAKKPKITISIAGGVNSSAGPKKDQDDSHLSGPQLFQALTRAALGIESSVENVTVIGRPSVDKADINVKMDAQKGMKRYNKSLLDHKDADQLIDNPQAIAPAKQIINNGQLLNNKQGNPVSFGADNLNALKASVAKAEEVQASQ